MQADVIIMERQNFPPLATPQRIELKKTAASMQLIYSRKTQQLALQLAETLTSSNLRPLTVTA